MGWSFRKRIKVLPGLWVNFSKSGISTTVGAKGANINIGKRGISGTIGLPETGIYKRERLSSNTKSDNCDINKTHIPTFHDNSAIIGFATDNKESISRKTRTPKPERPKKAPKFQKIKIETLLNYRESISDSKVQLLEDLLNEGVVYVEITGVELNNLRNSKGVKRIISFRELK